MSASGLSPAESAAIRKLLTRMAGYEIHEEPPDSLIELAAEAAGTHQDLQQRVSRLEAVVDTDEKSVDYQQMTKEDKVRKIRSYLYQRATEKRSGRAAIDYKEVRAIFDGRPAAGYCYELMKISGEADGFDYEGSPDQGKNKRITVKTGAVKDDAPFRSPNKEGEATTA